MSESKKKRDTEKSPITPELAEQLRENPYVLKLQGNKIKYTHDFYRAMYDRLKEGDSYMEAMASLGFDVQTLGTDRVKSAGQRAREMGENGTFNDLHPERFDGSKPLTVEELRSLSREDLVDRVLSRNLYLEVARAYEKKNALTPGAADLISDREALTDCLCAMADLLLAVLESFAVAAFCSLSQAACLAILGISSSTYYGHRKKLGRRDRHNRDEDLLIRDQMKAFILLHGFTPGKGTFRYWVSVRLGKAVSESRCGRIMKEFGFIATTSIRKGPYKGMATHDHPFLSPFNLVEGKFRIAPRRVIATDITYIYYGLSRQKVCYLCIYLDCFTQEALGWSVSDTMDTAFVLRAYEMMMLKHGLELRPGYTVIHSDGGSQYLAGDYRDKLILDRFRQSCSRRATPTDNAVIECFNGSFKATGLLNVERAECLEAVSTMCDNWLENSNSDPRDALAGLSPSEYYFYATTGVYPADSYLGVAADHLIDVKTFAARREAAAERSRERRRSAYQAKRDSFKAAADPLKSGTALEWVNQQIAKDLRRLKGLDTRIGKSITAAEKMNKQVTLVIDMIIEKALPYARTLSEKVAEELRTDPRKWLEHEPLKYIAEMALLF